MCKILKIIACTIFIMLLLTCAASLYIWNNFGDNPSGEEEAAYANLSYYKDGTFQSPEPLHYDFGNVRNGRAGFARMLTQSRFAPRNHLPKVMLDKASFPQKPENYALYWLGHSSAILELDGKRIIFDPVLGNAAPIPLAMPRYDESPVKRNELPMADYIVITHNHYDHLEKTTVQSINHGHFIVPLGVGAALRGWGIKPERITELGWNDSLKKDGLSITAVEGVHYSRRNLWNRNKTLWNSYIIKTDSKNIFWGGDTGYGRHFKHIGKAYGPFDLAVMEIDGWNTAWPNTHMFPHEVVQAAENLGVINILPVHWAVFDLALHPWHESIDMLFKESEGKNINIITPKIGERIIPGQTQTTHWWDD